MSRAAVSKSRADKTKGGASAQTPAVVREIVPGKYNDHDWNFMLDKDDGEDFITDITEDICNSALQIIYDNYIERQLLPFTILQAKDAILQIIEWQFLRQDIGEPSCETDETWLEDEEPIPAITDCWAQGIVPKQYVPRSTPVSATPEPITEEPAEEEETEEQSVQLSEEEVKEEDGAEAEVEASEEAEKKPQEAEIPEEKIKPQPPPSDTNEVKKKKRKFKPYGGRLKSAGLKGLTESLDQTEMRLMSEERFSKGLVTRENGDLQKMPTSCHSILKVQAGRPPGNKDVIYDDQGNVLSIVKFDPSKLPSHFIRTNFTVVDPAVEAAQARLEAMRTGRFVASSQKKKKPKFMSAMFAAASSGLPEERHKKDSKRDNIKSLPAPLIESMEVSPGVVVKEGNRVKRGPRQHPRTTETDTALELRPLLPHPPSPMFAASDILDCGTPILKLIQDSPPIPPITQKQMAV